MIQLKTGQTVLVIALLFLSKVGLGQSKGYVRIADGTTVSTAKITQHIENIMDSIALPGLSIALVNDRNIVYHSTFGVTDIETEQPITQKTIFEAASLSKPLFAYFMMMMVEDGQLAIDEPIFPYLKAALGKEETIKQIDPNALANYKTITPRMILSHQTGIPNWMHGKPVTVAFKPGTGFSYSGEAYQHLAAAFGTKMGIGWGSALDSMFIKKVAEPLGMDRSYYTHNDTIEKYVAKGHKDGVVTQVANKNEKVGPAHSLHSDAEDYAHFLIELMNPRYISEVTRNEMLKEHTHFKDNNHLKQEVGQTGWGLGMAQKPTEYGMMHMHTGNNHDFQAYMMILPEQQFGIVFFTNSNKAIPFIQGLNAVMGPVF